MAFRGYLICLLMGCCLQGIAGSDSFSRRFSGQASGHFLYNPEYAFFTGIRYLPRLTATVGMTGNRTLDVEGSANIHANARWQSNADLQAEGRIKPYRFWVRYANARTELRIGLQKINFGSALMLRPLMWFDQVDPRDPLQLTDGVWAALARHYFPNNSNIWLWALYGNKDQKTWEIGATQKGTPEFGGRLQTPLAGGETAFAFHHRMASLPAANALSTNHEQVYVPENRFGLEGRWDFFLGMWFEAAWIKKSGSAGLLTNQHIFCLGADYTIPAGNGLLITAEHLLLHWGEDAFRISNPYGITGLSVAYPIGLKDRISSIIYRDWNNSQQYHFVSWQHQLNSWTFYVMGFANPEIMQLPQQNIDNKLFAGKGLQFMLVFNH